MTTNAKVTALVAQTTAARLSPKTSITIAVDTAYVAAYAAAHPGQSISQGIYMMDNMVRNGSKGEGTLELTTVCNDLSLIGFNVVPIDIVGGNGDQVVITGFTVSQGSVFTAAGMPRQKPSPAGEPDGAYWIGAAMAQGSQTYQIQIEVTVGQLQPVSYLVNWDPFITAK